MTADPAEAELAVTRTFHDYFVPIVANTPHLLQQAFRIRYEVYCREFGFERPEDFPHGMETDEYDAQSLHCLLIHQPSGRAAGCVRLVLPRAETPDDPLPFERYCEPSLDKSRVRLLLADRTNIGEISRLAVIREFRRRSGEHLSPLGGDLAAGHGALMQMRQFPIIAVGLYLCAASTGLLRGLRGVFAMMEPRLARHLSRFGIRFEQVGALMDYHGPRAPFYITRENLVEGLRPELGALLDSIQSDLASSIRAG